MNEQLIKFIELCLMDGVVTDKEREVIFRKSKELGVPEDECEIILEGMIQQKGGVSEVQNIPQVVNSIEKKELELTFNNLNQTKVLKKEINDLELELKEKKTLINKSETEIKRLKKDISGVIKNKKIEKEFDRKCLRDPFENIEGGGKSLDYLISLFFIDEQFFEDITPDSEGLIFVVKYEIYIKTVYIVFKKENDKIVRFMVDKRNFELKIREYFSLGLYREQENFLFKNIKLVNNVFVHLLLGKSSEVFNPSENLELEIDKSYFMKLLRGSLKFNNLKWEGKIVNEELLDLELELFNRLTHKVYLN